jgi:translation initiation factor 2B subunit (eIF-2B alpha/beta/delta family)
MSQLPKKVFGFHLSRSGAVNIWACSVIRETPNAFVLDRRTMSRAVDWNTPIVQKMRSNVFTDLGNMRAEMIKAIENRRIMLRDISEKLEQQSAAAIAGCDTLAVIDSAGSEIESLPKAAAENSSDADVQTKPAKRGRKKIADAAPDADPQSPL